MTVHTCHAEGCPAKVPPKMLMCGRHWRMVPRPLQRAIWATYRRGQEQDKNPSAAYMAVQRLACAAVARDERRHREAAHFKVQAAKWCERARERGERLPAGVEVYL